jgi:transcriptional regulator with XRE-family HTH domain
MSLIIENKEFKKFREQSGLTRAEMAKLLGYTEDHIYRVEAGKRALTQEFADRFDNVFNIEQRYRMAYEQEELKNDYLALIVVLVFLLGVLLFVWR